MALFSATIMIHVREPHEIPSVSDSISDRLVAKGYRKKAETRSWKVMAGKRVLIKMKAVLGMPRQALADVSAASMYRSGILVRVEAAEPEELVEAVNALIEATRGYPSELESA